MPKDRGQRVDGGNGVTCLFIIFAPTVMVIKTSKWLIFCIYCFGVTIREILKVEI